MTIKSPANAAHDAARAEDARRAHAELHEYITSLERQLRTRAEVADHARATLNEHLAAAEKQLAEVTRERDELRDHADIAEEQRDEARQQRDQAAEEAREELHEAQEQGARWALDAVTALVVDLEREGKAWGGTGFWRGCQERGDFDAARICVEARAKGGK